jgi:dTDP-6-deoxy-L-talose 4-dehydrogenase (NAD+)
MDPIKTIAVTGATGFVGKHTVHFLRQFTGCRVVAVGRNEAELQKLGSEYVVHDLEESPAGCFEKLGRPDVLMHLAWDGLQNYQDLVHIERSLPVSYYFIKSMVQQGLDHVTVTGTCLEYGLQNGRLSEDQSTFPSTPYAIAKDALRRFLQALQRQQNFRLKWARLFYMYGKGQNATSLFAQLDLAIRHNEKEFDMSDGQQLRDYLPVEEVAKRLSLLALNPEINGIVNICSGRPVSIRSLVEGYLTERNAQIRLNLGRFSRPAHEPLAFWGDHRKYERIIDHLRQESRSQTSAHKGIANLSSHQPEQIPVDLKTRSA